MIIIAQQVLNDEMFSILVLIALITTFMTTPTVIAICKPLRRVASQTQRRLERQLDLTDNSQIELRILACIHAPRNVQSLINLIESIRTTKKSPLKLYVMHLVELTDRSSSIMMVQRTRKNGVPFSDRFPQCASQDQIAAAFEAYGHFGRVSIRHSTAISALSTMHEDICHLAEDKRVGMIILPFHKQWRGEGEEAIQNVGHSWGGVNQRVLKSAPCSVAVLVDRGFGVGSEQVTEPTATMPKRACIMFFGGPDDREALELGGRMAEQPAVKVTLTRFFRNAGVESDSIAEWDSMNHQTEKELDEAAAAEFKTRWSGLVEYEEKLVSNITDGVLAIGQSREYELIVVGKGQFQSTMVARSTAQQPEHPELGPIGDILASSDHGILSSVLVIQQHNIDKVNEATAIVQDKEAIIINAVSTNDESSV